LRFFGIDIPIIRFVALVALWYFVGPILYNWLASNIVAVQYEGIEILYMPIQKILEVFENFV